MCNTEKRERIGLVPRLLLGVILGAVTGIWASPTLMEWIVVGKNLLGQIIFFLVPLIILGFIAPSIASLKENASKLLSTALLLAYGSTLGAGFLGLAGGYFFLPTLEISTQIEGLASLPTPLFTLEITPIMPVMSGLLLALLIGISVSATNSKQSKAILVEFQNMVLFLVSHIILPILPFFVGFTFATLSYQGGFTKQLPIFFSVILLAVIGQLIWLVVLYSLAGIYTKSNPKEVYRHYLPAYLTAIGTMSSAATLPVSLRCARNSTALSEETLSFGIPLFSNIHLCGSVLTEVFFVMAVSQILYGGLPSLVTMIIFVLLLGIFGIGAPGVPGGTVMASLGLITGILGFETQGTALMMTIFALQDSFGTACNVTGDGALTLILEKVKKVSEK